MPRYIGRSLAGTANSSVTSPAPGPGGSVKRTINSGVFTMSGGAENSIPIRRNGVQWLKPSPLSVTSRIEEASNNYIHVTRDNPANPASSGNPNHPATTPSTEISPTMAVGGHGLPWPGTGVARRAFHQGVQSNYKTFPAATKFVVVKLYGGISGQASNSHRPDGGYTEIRMGPKAAGNTFWFTTNGFHPGSSTSPSTYGSHYNIPIPFAWGGGLYGHPHGGSFASISSARFDQPSAPTPAATKQGQTVALAAGGGGTHHQATAYGGNAGYAGTPTTAGKPGGTHAGNGYGGNGATLAAGGSGQPGSDGVAMAGKVGVNSPDGRGGGGGNGYWGGESGVGYGGRGGGGGGGSNYYALAPSPFAPLFLDAAGQSIANSVFSVPHGFKPGATDPGRPTLHGGNLTSVEVAASGSLASVVTEEQLRKGYVIVHAFSEDVSATYSADEPLNLFYDGHPGYQIG